MKPENTLLRAPVYGLSRMATMAFLGVSLLCGSGVASADAFGGGGAASAALEARLADLERALKELKEERAAAPVATGGPSLPGEPPAPGALTPPPPPDDPLAAKFVRRTGYSLIAEVDGNFLVRDGDARRLLTPAEFDVFKRMKAEEEAKAKLAETAAGAPPAPPPVAGGSQPTLSASRDAAAAAEKAALTPPPRETPPPQAKKAKKAAPAKSAPTPASAK